jgi:hypothetical protein
MTERVLGTRFWSNIGATEEHSAGNVDNSDAVLGRSDGLPLRPVGLV